MMMLSMPAFNSRFGSRFNDGKILENIRLFEEEALWAYER